MFLARLLQIIFGGLASLLALLLLAGAAAKDPSLLWPLLVLLMAGMWMLSGRVRSLRPLLVGLFVILLLPIVIAKALNSQHPLGGLAVLMIVSCGAYLWREHGLRGRRRRVLVRGAERTPVLPHREDDE